MELMEVMVLDRKVGKGEDSAVGAGGDFFALECLDALRRALSLRPGW